MKIQRPSPGFTLVELIVVMVIVGVVAGIVAMQLGPAFQSYAAVKKRTNLTHQADTALRRMVAEVRTAVPNSLRLMSPCLEMAPTIDGGRFRMAADSMAPGSDPLDLSQPDTGFDVLTGFDTKPQAGDWIVIGNQNTDDVYTGASRAQIATGGVGAAVAGMGLAHINLSAAKQFPYGYEGGRFGVVPDRQQAVTYVCSNTGVSNGTGTGTLQRISHYGFNGVQACPVSGGTAAIVATKVESCQFIYSPNSGATQQSGFVQLQLKLTDGGESVLLTVGSQVENVP